MSDLGHVTLHDVAKRCKVSTATVSAVVNDATWVSVRTRARVQRAVADMGYHPNQLARGLKRREGHAVGVIVSDLTNPFFTQIVRSLSHALRAGGRTLSLCDSDHRGDVGAANLRMLVEGQVVGLVLIGDCVPQEALSQFVAQRAHVPVIAIEREYGLDTVSTLLVDSERGAYAATRHLLDGGRRRVAMITGPSTGAGSATYGRLQRFLGYRRALEEAGVAFDATLVAEGTLRYEGGCDAMRVLLPRNPDAIFAINDMTALGAMSVVRDAGLSVPDDIAIVGFDNVPITALTTPGLTTVAMPMGALGDAAAALLEEQLTSAGRHAPVRQIFSTELVERDSSRRAPASHAAHPARTTSRSPGA